MFAQTVKYVGQFIGSDSSVIIRVKHSEYVAEFCVVVIVVVVVVVFVVVVVAAATLLVRHE